MPRLILFICDGNIFRSAAALAFSRQFAAQRGVAERYEFNGAGLYGLNVGQSPHVAPIAELARYGLDISAYRSRKLSPEEAQASSLIVVMSRQQRALISACFGVSRQRIALITELTDPAQDLPDVGIGSFSSVPVRVAQIRRYLDEGWPRLLYWADQDAPVWDVAPETAGSQTIRLRPVSLSDNMPCPYQGDYQYWTTAPDPRPDPVWHDVGKRISLAAVNLDADEVVLDSLPRLVHISSGGIVFRQVEGQLLFALSQRKGESWWELPVGTVDGPESLRQTAQRELGEETGYSVQLLDYIHYSYSTIPGQLSKIKVCHYFLAEAQDPTGQPVDPDTRCIWLPASEALDTLVWAERAILRRAFAELMRLGLLN